MVLRTRDSIWPKRRLWTARKTERRAPPGGPVTGDLLPRGVWPRALPVASVPTLKSCRRHSASCRSRELNHGIIVLSELPSCTCRSPCLRQGRPCRTLCTQLLGSIFPTKACSFLPSFCLVIALSFFPSLSPSFFSSVFLPLPFPSSPIDPGVRTYLMTIHKPRRFAS